MVMSIWRAPRRKFTTKKPSSWNGLKLETLVLNSVEYNLPHSVGLGPSNRCVFLFIPSIGTPEAHRKDLGIHLRLWTIRVLYCKGTKACVFFYNTRGINNRIISLQWRKITLSRYKTYKTKAVEREKLRALVIPFQQAIKVFLGGKE